MVSCPLAEVMGEALDEEAAAPWIDHPGASGFIAQEQLRGPRDARREIARQCQRFVERVCMQRLCLAVDRRRRFDACPGYIVEHVLRRERPARSLAMGSERQRPLILRFELCHDLRPQEARRPELGDLHEIIHADPPEERQPRCECIDAKAAASPARTYSM